MLAYPKYANGRHIRAPTKLHSIHSIRDRSPFVLALPSFMAVTHAGSSFVLSLGSGVLTPAWSVLVRWSTASSTSPLSPTFSGHLHGADPGCRLELHRLAGSGLTDSPSSDLRVLWPWLLCSSPGGTCYSGPPGDVCHRHSPDVAA